MRAPQNEYCHDLDVGNHHRSPVRDGTRHVAGLMKPTPTRRKKPVTLKGPPYEPCENCTNGWVNTTNGPIARVVRCWCWQSWRAKVEEYSRLASD